MATKDGRNIEEVWTHIIINSHNFIHISYKNNQQDATV